MNKPSLFLQKCLLLCRGVNITKDLENKCLKLNISLNKGRKGGAGPAGGRYFSVHNSVVNIPLYYSDINPSPYNWIDIDQNRNCTFTDSTGRYIFETFQLIDIPKYYSQISSDGIPYYKLGLIHSKDVFSTTICQKCCHWEQGNQCKFCGIEYSLQSGATIETKSGQQLVEAIKAALEEDPNQVTHITLTAGTSKNQKKLIERYAEISNMLHTAYPNIPIHIQLEPVVEKEWFDLLKENGVATVGIHIEILDDNVRKEMCPGKSKISYETYKKAWKLGCETFGVNNISSFILIGYPEDKDIRASRLKEMVELGVVPFIVPVRYIPQNPYECPEVNPFELYDICYDVSKEMIKNNRDPFKNIAGCVPCGACGPILDAYEFVKAGNQKEKK